MFRKFLKEYFNFSRGEQTGVITLLVLSMLLVVLPHVYSFIYKPTLPDNSQIKSEINAFEASLKIKNTKGEIQQPYNLHQSNPKAINFHTIIMQPVIELNTADTSALESLPGIGPILAKRIVKYRHSIGGFYQLAQLTEVYGVKPELVKSLSARLKIDTLAIQPIYLLPDSLKRLFHHPYLMFNDAKAIANFVQKSKTRVTPQMLFNSNIISSATCSRIRHYIK